VATQTVGAAVQVAMVVMMMIIIIVTVILTTAGLKKLTVHKPVSIFQDLYYTGRIHDIHKNTFPVTSGPSLMTLPNGKCTGLFPWAMQICELPLKKQNLHVNKTHNKDARV
jgi:hypothetical protein